MSELRPLTHFAALDGMRGVLALGVVLLHLGFNSFIQRWFGWPGIAFDLAVDVFFVLSGFVLSHAQRRGSSFTAFAVRRCFRLVPVYLLTTFAAAFALTRVPSLADWFIAAPLVGQPVLNFPAWSITWELYLPLLAVLLGRWPPGRAALPLLLLALTVLAVLDTQVVMGGQLYGWRAGFGLAAGALLYRVRPSVPGPVEAWFGLLAVGMAAGQTYPPLAALVPFAAAGAVIAGCAGRSLFTLSPLQGLGSISYSLYMIHVPVLAASQAYWGSGVDANALAKLGILVASLVIAALLTSLIEQPLNRIGHRLSHAISLRQGLDSPPAPTIRSE